MKKYLTISGIILLLTFILYNSKIKADVNNKIVNESANNINKEILKDKQSDQIEKRFLDITIPALRDREYTSNIDKLTRLSENNIYTSYLTSYNSDGNRINGLLTVPKGQKPANGWPAIVFIHGYIPPASYKTTSNYVSYVDYLAKNKMVVFKIDLRGHGESEGEPSGGYYSSGYVIDALNAYNALEKYEDVDKSKIGIWGHSMAGNITLRSVAVKKTIPAVAIWAGAGYTYQDIIDYGIRDNSYRPPTNNSTSSQFRQSLFEKFGRYSNTSNFWQQVSPVNYLDGVTTAISLNHATDDNVVSINYSRNLVDILNKKNIKHELNEYKTGGHNISGNSFNDAMLNTVNFFKSNL